MYSGDLRGERSLIGTIGNWRQVLPANMLLPYWLLNSSTQHNLDFCLLDLYFLWFLSLLIYFLWGQGSVLLAGCSPRAIQLLLNHYLNRPTFSSNGSVRKRTKKRPSKYLRALIGCRRIDTSDIALKYTFLHIWVGAGSPQPWAV